MINFLTILVCFGAGYAVRLARIVPEYSYKGVNAWILYIALPACTLRYIPFIHWTTAVLLPVTAPVLVWAGAWGMGTIYGRLIPAGSGTVAALRLTGGLSNTAFLGFVAVFYGEQELVIAVLFDQVSFVLLSTAGAWVAIRAAGGQQRAVWRRMARFPPFVICIVALLWPRPAALSPLLPLLDKISTTIGPMALFSIGMQLNFAACRRQWRPLVAGLTYKLWLAPLLVLALTAGLGMRGPAAQISVFESAMPTLGTAGVLADEYALNPALANGMVGVSILLSFATMPCWWRLLHFLGG